VTDGLPMPRRLWAAVVLLLGIGLTVLDASSLNVALPAISDEFGVQPASVVWIVNAYSLTVLSLLLPLAAVAERVGFRRMFVCGMSLFLASAALGALSTSLPWLIAARMGQGVGAASLMCLFGGLVRAIYPREMLGRGISWNAMTVGMTAVLGPSIGSTILAAGSWRWILLLSLPIGLLALAGVRKLPEVPTVRARFDMASALLSMLMFGLFVVGLDHLASHPLRALAMMALAVLPGRLLYVRSRRQAAPLAPVDLLHIPAIGFAVSASAFMFAAQMATIVSLPFYFLKVLGRDYLELGMLMGAWPIGTAVMAPVAGWLSDRAPAARLSAIGAAVMVAGLATLLGLPKDVGNGWIMLTMTLTGIGFGFFQTPNNRAMLSSAPLERSGAAGGMQATTRVFGQSVGAACVAVGFGLHDTQGPILGLCAALLCASAAVALNLWRMRAE